MRPGWSHSNLAAFRNVFLTQVKIGRKFFGDLSCRADDFKGIRSGNKRTFDQVMYWAL